MLNRLTEDETLYQNDAAVAIREIFGDEFVYNNQNGNLAIRQIVLGKFRKLTKGKAVWSRSGHYWCLK